MASEVEAARQRVVDLNAQVAEAKAAHDAAVRASDDDIELARLHAEESRLQDELAAIKESTAQASAGEAAATTIEQIEAPTRKPAEDAPPLGTVEPPQTSPVTPSAPPPPPLSPTPSTREEL